MLKFLEGAAIHLANSITCKSFQTLASSLLFVFDDRVSLNGSTYPMDLVLHICFPSKK